MTAYASSSLFALDIGTRSVVGLLLQRNDDQFELIDSVVKEHDERAMHDGQIHDVQSVAATIRAVKEQLEERNGPLHKVCVAAAGRSLKTRRAQITIDIDGKPIFNHDDVLHLELSAVQQAQFQLASEPDKDARIDYYCVGYSVLGYHLDHEPIGSLIDQTGKQASVNVIATFLPSVVIESLTAALVRAELELGALTLEPIAAIHVLIPPSMRRLNVALVDIGAGTSDIALTDENTVTAYGMVPIAGDEVTEALSDHFLLDFPDAEMVKRSLATNEEITMIDILGMESTYTKEEIITPLEETIDRLARTIGDEILSLNGRAPKAVMLVGGGSLTPNLPKRLSSYLGLPENRVAIRDADAIKQLKKAENDHFGPELVTPIGIAVAAKEHAIKSIRITVNGQPVRLFDVKKLTVGDGLLAAGINIAKLYGKPGLALMATLNDRLISIPGGHGQPPTLLKNGEETTLDERLMPGDELFVERGKDGEKAEVTIAEFLGDIPVVSISLNGRPIELPAVILKNGKPAQPNMSVEERDVITVDQTKTVRDLLVSENISPTLFERSFLYVNEEQWFFTHALSPIKVNGNTAELDSSLQQGDRVEWEQNVRDCTVEDILQSKDICPTVSITVFYNGNPITLEKEIIEVKRENEQLTRKSVVHANERLTVKTVKPTPFILQDIFTVIQIDLSKYTGKRVSIQKNRAEASFTDLLQNGDKVDLIIE